MRVYADELSHICYREDMKNDRFSVYDTDGEIGELVRGIQIALQVDRRRKYTHAQIIRDALQKLAISMINEGIDVERFAAVNRDMAAEPW